MRLHIDKNELEMRIALNCRRLSEGDYYHIEQVFSPSDYEWYGDKEGRALLSFVSHYKISGVIIPCMTQMLQQLDEHLNSHGFFGPVFEDQIHEEQLSGHSWLLRGLCEHYELFGDAFSKQAVLRIAENLYLPKIGRFSSYPIDRETREEGDVSGSGIGTVGDWILSSDVGCAFMSIDGLSHAYAITKDERIRQLVDEMSVVYLGIDKVRLKAQTHCTLTAARGMLRMYHQTGAAHYLNGAESILELYMNGGGVSATYQNLNWWGRADTWTEPCAIVDSLMLATELYKVTKKPSYRTFAARVFFTTDWPPPNVPTAAQKRIPWCWTGWKIRYTPKCMKRSSVVPCGWRKDCGTFIRTAIFCMRKRQGRLSSTGAPIWTAICCMPR